MWELALIAQDFEPRRQAIFADIDRKDGPMWAQVYAICMDLLKQMEMRVDAYGKPVVPVAAQPVEPTAPKQRTSAPLRQDAIFTKQGGAPGPVEKAWDQIARAPGSSPMSELSPLAKKTWKSAKDSMLSKEQQAALSPDNLRHEFGNWTTSLMQVGLVGGLFQHDFRTRFAGVVLGTPYGEPSLYSNAITALCQLAVNSLGEDQFGNVHRDVPSIVRTLTAVIRKVEALRQRFPLHWTDTKGEKESPEMDHLLDALRTGLDQVVTKFEPYSTDLRLTLGDMRLAKEAAVKPQKQLPAAKEKETTIKPKLVEEKRKEPAKVHRREFKRVEMEQVR